MTTVIIKKHSDFVGNTDANDELLDAVNELADHFDAAGLGLGVEITVNLPNAAPDNNHIMDDRRTESKPRNTLT